MANLKLIKVTGSPFSDASIGKIGIQKNDYQFDIIREGRLYDQESSFGKGWRYATAEEIAENWKLIYPHWTPEIGDRVIITQDFQDWTNSRGTIIEKDGSSDYYRVESVTGRSCIFDYTCQMILAPYSESKVELEEKAKLQSKHGFTLGERVLCVETGSPRANKAGTVVHFDGNSIGVAYDDYSSGHGCNGYCPDGKGWYSLPQFIKHYTEPTKESKPKEETVIVRFLTEQEFKYKDLWRETHPKGWNSDGEMNKYLGQSAVIPKSSIRSDGAFRYEDWTFSVNDYIVTEEVSISKSISTPVIATKPDRPSRRFKVGDKVTYKSLAQCGGDYRYGGSDQGGFVGTVESESEYEPTRGCYGLRVSTKDGFCYNMLECEFCEYDGTTIHSTLHIHKTTTDSFTLLADATVITPTFFGHVDPLFSYKQKPITIKQKPKSKLTII